MTNQSKKKSALSMSGKKTSKTTTSQKEASGTNRISSVCFECGVSANVLTKLKSFGRPPLKVSHTISTYHIGRCDVCKIKKEVTEARDFFYPDFSLLLKVMRKFKEKKAKNEAKQKGVS